MATHLMKSKTSKVYKNKKLNNANFGDFTLNDYQVFLQLISKLGKVTELGKYQQPDQLERTHILTAQEFAKAFNIEPKHAYTVIKQAVKKLMKTSIVLEQYDLFSSTCEINICSKAEYKQDEGKIVVKFTDDIMPYLAQVSKKFVLYNLKEISNFGSLYSTRLYELIQEFKDTGFVTKSIQQLRDVFAVGEKLKKYNDFKRFTFAHAVDEINSQYDMNLTFNEIKEGRKVLAITFCFKKTFIHKIINRQTGNERNIYIKPKPINNIK